MTDFNADGYTDLREYVASSNGWEFVALYDDTGTEETEIDIDSDGRASWGDTSTNPVTLTLNLSGGDSDISTPVEISEAALRGATSGSDFHRDDIKDDSGSTANVIIGSGDSVTIEYDVELPQV